MQIKKNLFILIGASRGLGEALYEEISSRNDNYIVLVNRKKTVSGHIHGIKEIKCDLSKPISYKKLSDIFSGIFQCSYDSMTLVCNASVLGPIDFVGTLDPASIEALWNVNIVNHVLFINEFIRQSKKCVGPKKRILAISSGAAVSPHGGIALYCATKAALEMLVRTIFEEQKTEQCVEIATIRPGIMDTDMQKHIRSASSESFHDVGIYRKLKIDKKLLPPAFVAKKLYEFLLVQKQWESPVIDISTL